MTLHLVAEDGGALVIDPDTFTRQVAGGVARVDEHGDITVFVRAPGQRATEAVVRPAAGGPEAPKTAAEPPKAGEAPGGPALAETPD